MDVTHRTLERTIEEVLEFISGCLDVPPKPDVLLGGDLGGDWALGYDTHQCGLVPLMRLAKSDLGGKDGKS